MTPFAIQTPPLVESVQFLLAERLAPWLINYAVHSSLLIVAALLLARLTTSTLGRERLWKFALLGPFLTASLQVGAFTGPFPGPFTGAELGSTLAPDLTTANLSESITSMAASSSTQRAASLDLASLTPGAPGALGSSVETIGIDASMRSPASSSPWKAYLAAAWLLLAALAALHFFHVRRRLVSQLGHRKPVRGGPLQMLLVNLSQGSRLAGRLKLTESDELTSPIAIGRNEICVPERVSYSLDEGEQTSLLAHELAHLERRDPAWLTAFHVLGRIFFFQPLLRSVRRRMQADMELAADASAVRRTQDPVRMAHCLARVAEWVAEDRKPLFAPGMASSHSDLVRRIETVLEPQDQARAKRSGRLIACVGFLSIGALSYAGPRVHGAVAPPTEIERAHWELQASWADLEGGLTEDLQAAEKAAGQDQDTSISTDVPILSDIPILGTLFQATQSEVPIGLGDELRIYDALRPNELDRKEQVQGLGSIILPDLGRVEVLGLTRSKLEMKLRKIYSQYYVQCEIHVQHSPKPRHYFMHGAVGKSGARSLKQGTTVFEAVTASESKRAGQELSSVQLIRPDALNPLVITIDVGHMLRTGDSSMNVVLQGGDIIYVPEAEQDAEKNVDVDPLTQAQRLMDAKLRRYLDAQGTLSALLKTGTATKPQAPHIVSDPRGWAIEFTSDRTQKPQRITLDEDSQVLTIGAPIDPAAYEPVIDWLQQAAQKMEKRTHTSANGLPPIDLPDEPLTLLLPSTTPFRVVQKIMEICGRRDIGIWKIQLASTTDQKQPKLLPAYLPIDTCVIGDGEQQPRVEITLRLGTPKPAPNTEILEEEEDAEPQPTLQYRIRWDLLGKPYSAAAVLDTSSPEGISSVLADLLPQASRYQVVMDCRAGTVYQDVVGIVDMVLAAGFTDISFVGSYDKL